MKRIVQNLLAVFLLAVLLVPVTALGAGCKPYAHAVDKGAETVWDWTIPDKGFASVTVSARCKNCNEMISTTAIALQSSVLSVQTVRRAEKMYIGSQFHLADRTSMVKKK